MPDDFEYRHLRLKGIKLRPDTDVGKALKIEDLFRDGYKAIFIGTGAMAAQTRCTSRARASATCTTPSTTCRTPTSTTVGESGRSSSARATRPWTWRRTAIRHGTRHIECFSLSSHITASEYEAKLCRSSRACNFIFNKKPLEITDKGVVFIDLSEAEDGTLTEIPGTEKLYPADSVIVSISQGPCTTITDSTKDLKTTPRGLFETDEGGPHAASPASLPAAMRCQGRAHRRSRPSHTARTWPRPCTSTCRPCPPTSPTSTRNVPVAEYDEGN